ncbi:MAG: helix-turn-helix transcriptional regulator [Fluviicola sp.]|nr:helix-turn-helix transcriptional regulator [Fluviicola sp.]
MEIRDRIKMIIESHRLTAGAFADKIGVQRSNVSHVLGGRNKPSYEFLEKLLQAFPRVSAQWLLTGKQVPDGVELPVLESVKRDEVTVVAKETKGEQLKPVKESKKIIKTLVFYEDFTFDVFLPNEQ